MSPIQVLLVEDKPAERLALAGVLKRHPSLEVTEASDGLQAWEMLEAGLRPDVCCSAIRMPRMDGLALADRAGAHPVLGYLPLILLASRAERVALQRTGGRRVAGFIVRPASGLDTHGVIERVVRQAQFRRAERPLTSCGRLGLDPAGLLALLGALAGELGQLGPGSARALPGPVADRLARTARALGLWQAAELLESPEAGAAPVPGLLEEVQRLVRLQMEAATRMPRLHGAPVWAAGRGEAPALTPAALERLVLAA